MRIQQFIRSTEVIDVGYVGIDKYFVDFFILYRRQRTRVIRVVRSIQDWFFNIRQIDVDYCRVFRICIGFQQFRIRQLFFYVLNTTFQGTTIVVIFRDYLFQQDDVRVQVFDDRFFVQFDGIISGRTFGGRIGQFKGLFNFQIRQIFNFQDAVREDVFFVFFFNGQQILFDRIQRNSVYQIAQGDVRLYFVFEAYQNGFRYIKRYYVSCGSKRYQIRIRRERDIDRETGMGVIIGIDGIRQQYTVQLGVNDVVIRTQRYIVTVYNEVRQRVVRVYVNWFRIRRGVVERLYYQVSREVQVRQVFQFITGYRVGGVLGIYRSYFRFIVRVRTNVFYVIGTVYYFLRQREVAIVFSDIFRLTEYIIVRQIKCFTRFGGQVTFDNQRNTVISTYFINQYVGFQFEGRQQFVGFVVTYFIFVRVNVNYVVYVQVRDVDFDWQCIRVFYRVKEDGCNFIVEV